MRWWWAYSITTGRYISRIQKKSGSSSSFFEAHLGTFRMAPSSGAYLHHESPQKQRPGRCAGAMPKCVGANFCPHCTFHITWASCRGDQVTYGLRGLWGLWGMKIWLTIRGRGPPWILAHGKSVKVKAALTNQKFGTDRNSESGRLGDHPGVPDSAWYGRFGRCVKESNWPCFWVFKILQVCF